MDIQKQWEEKALKRGFINNAEIIPVRKIKVGEKCSKTSKISENGVNNYNSRKNKHCGSQFYYSEEEDKLVNWGRGIYVLYEKGIWAKLKMDNYEIY